MKKLAMMLGLATLMTGFSFASINQPKCRANQSIGVTIYCIDSNGIPVESGAILGLDRAYNFAIAGQTEFKKGNLEQALFNLGNARKFQRQGDATKAIFDGYMMVARYYFNSGNYNAAILAGQYATEQLPTNYQGYWVVAESYHMQGLKSKRDYYLQFVRKYAKEGGQIRTAIENKVKTW